MISVIVPNYNHANYLQQRIDSILNQTYQDFELILLDDCSTDESQQILEEYKEHPKVAHLIFSESNSGSPFKQWAKGIHLAKGKYIWIAESDDFAESTFLERCVGILEKSPKIGIVYSDSNIIESGKIIDNFKNNNTVRYPQINWNIDHYINGLKEIEMHLIKNCSIYNVSGVLFRAVLIKKVVDKIIKLRYAGDWLCYLFIACETDIYYIAECLNNYRTHENNATKKAGLNYVAMYERIVVRSTIMNFLDGKNIAIIRKARQFNLIELRAILGGFIRGRITAQLFCKMLKQYF